MNWETTKTWLIVSFSLLDLFLGWQLVQDRQEMQSYTEPYADLLASTKTLLADHGFSLDTSVPSSAPNLSTLKATFAKPKLANLVAEAFPKNTSALRQNASAGTAQGAPGSVKLLGNGTWQVSYTVPQPLHQGHPGQVLNWVDNGSLYHLDPILSGPGTKIFDEVYNGFPIFDATVDSTVDTTHLYGYMQTELVHIAPADKVKPVITALDALDSLAQSMDKSTIGPDNKIESITLGYAQKVDTTGSETAASNYWFPVWRIVSGSTVYYINAFSGEVETASS
ncbi:two-component system regulatory protein YycI [Alicyclobacillus sp. ALC3]|uniref:two-component system regulatory protein YycI n=1 Tax=Alicyclobacillus sp. ALC3 TaxID=2796143 RepID=UPI00237968B9|nr:two-component system regulatory protein YycI [Alicyclobacillus sp. ALC3]WDL99175.1 two-component system regulatory protein YycI [Alicyclobacillus sp. ALC3]